MLGACQTACSQTPIDRSSMHALQCANVRGRIPCPRARACRASLSSLASASPGSQARGPLLASTRCVCRAEGEVAWGQMGGVEWHGIG
eukprot:9627940-Alexandrium_andersonii.AAC.1